jgi:hypothetical protein
LRATKLDRARNLIARGARLDARRDRPHAIPAQEHSYYGGGGNLDIATQALSATANFLRVHGPGDQPGEPNFAAIQAWSAAPIHQQALAIMDTDRQLNCEELGRLQKPLNSNGKIGFVWPSLN